MEPRVAYGTVAADRAPQPRAHRERNRPSWASAMGARAARRSVQELSSLICSAPGWPQAQAFRGGKARLLGRGACHRVRNSPTPQAGQRVPRGHGAKLASSPGVAVASNSATSSTRRVLARVKRPAVGGVGASMTGAAGDGVNKRRHCASRSPRPRLASRPYWRIRTNRPGVTCSAERRRNSTAGSVSSLTLAAARTGLATLTEQPFAGSVDVPAAHSERTASGATPEACFRAAPHRRTSRQAD